MQQFHHPATALRPVSYTHLLRDIRQPNKASLVFTLPHEEGSHSQVLSILSFYKLNLTKIQSLPLVGKEWQYMSVSYTHLMAITYYNKVKTQNPLMGEAYVGLSTAYAANRQLDRALSTLDEAVELMPDFSEGYKERGRIKLMLRCV